MEKLCQEGVYLATLTKHTALSDLQRRWNPSVNAGADAADIAASLGNGIKQLTETLLGPCNRAVSSNHEWRWGSKGSLAVCVAGDRRGSFYNFETGEGGDALDLVKAVHGYGTVNAIHWAAAWLGQTMSADMRASRPNVARPADDESAKIASALTIWSQCESLPGTLAEKYLEGRSIRDTSRIEDLRFHPSCPVRTVSGQTIELPAMIGLFRRIVGNEPVSIHRTFLLSDGSGQVNPVEYGIVSAKMMLGPSKGAAIKLCPDDEIETGLGIAEGIENALTMTSRNWRPIWALGSAGAIQRFPVLNGIECLTIFADADDRGAGMEAATRCGRQWVEAGREVFLQKPRDGEDWNDTAIKEAA